jgi:hypothetical protein
VGQEKEVTPRRRPGRRHQGRYENALMVCV